jgi:hypothetical protein
MPFRLNPRIFPAVVSATVAASEAITTVRPQAPVTNSVFGDAPAAGCAIALLGKMTEPAIPAPKVAKPPTKERLPSAKSVNRLPEFLCTGGFFMKLSSGYSASDKPPNPATVPSCELDTGDS